MAFADWLKIFKRIADSGGRATDAACPECGKSSVDYQYIGDAKTRIGYLRIWCPSCRKGVHLSRVKIPESAPMLSFDAPKDELDRRQPDFEELEP
jgi:hypothetical protein